KQLEVNTELKDIVENFTKASSQKTASDLTEEQVNKIRDLFLDMESSLGEERAIYHCLFGIDVTESLTRLLSKARSSDYLAVLAYVQQTPEVDDVMAEFRRRIVEKHAMATTLGYGPRYLHSTGQLYKGGPNTGIFLLITTEHESDVPIPGKPYSFGLLADAQALGDLRALKSTGRRVIRVHLSRGEAGAISKLLNELG
ncbi:hypothetical protein ACFLTL_02145, partial [Chloroflexota bacterium]